MFFYHFIGEKHIVKIHISIKHIVNIILYQTFSHITFISLSVYMSIKKRYKIWANITSISISYISFANLYSISTCFQP